MRLYEVSFFLIRKKTLFQMRSYLIMYLPPEPEVISSWFIFRLPFLNLKHDPCYRVALMCI